MNYPQVTDNSHGALSNWLAQWFAQAGQDEKALMIQGVYAIWLARNEARDGRRISDAREVAKSARHFLLEWDQAHVTVHREPGWHKVNIDGATAKGDNRGAGFWLIRDDVGAFRGAGTAVWAGISCGEAAEVRACPDVVTRVAMPGFNKVLLNSIARRQSL